MKVETSNATTKTVGGNANYVIIIRNIGNVTLFDVVIVGNSTVCHFLENFLLSPQVNQYWYESNGMSFDTKVV